MKHAHLIYSAKTCTRRPAMAIINEIVQYACVVRYRCRIIISYRKFQKCMRADDQKLIILLEWP